MLKRFLLLISIIMFSNCNGLMPVVTNYSGVTSFFRSTPMSTATNIGVNPFPQVPGQRSLFSRNVKKTTLEKTTENLSRVNLPSSVENLVVVGASYFVIGGGLMIAAELLSCLGSTKSIPHFLRFSGTAFLEAAPHMFIFTTPFLLEKDSTLLPVGTAVGSVLGLHKAFKAIDL